MNENQTPKQKAEAQRRACRVEQGQSSKVTQLQEVIKEQEQAEAFLYAQRGYGGYIKTEHLEEIRTVKEEAVTEILEEEPDRRLQ